MNIVADLKAIKQFLEDAKAIESGPVKVEIAGTLTVTVTAENGKVILDTTVDVDA